MLQRITVTLDYEEVSASCAMLHATQTKVLVGGAKAGGFHRVPWNPKWYWYRVWCLFSSCLLHHVQVAAPRERG